MDFDWKTMLDSARETWLAMSPSEQKRTGEAIALVIALLALCLPVALLSLLRRRANKRRPGLSGNRIAHVHASQATDLWYQESRRFLDARTAALRSIATGAGLGLAASGTILAIAEAPRVLLYAAAALHFFAFFMCTTAQVASTIIYRAQANELSKRVAGADPDEIVAFELIRPMTHPGDRKAAFGYALAMLWMAAGWLFILAAVMMMATR
ncbi:hypothetical protein IPU70_08000 [Achromobacter sp. SD115]|uniref:hypothetical protein n=1 Tax=Achromobacter sp. SD115 TaxID=2782011 RepID=UPI001A96A05A|nr:hypothetical protein [Achromobacter sp. SD115]MBO1013486.1 hypothetical protein [Achromobacter sp. SD115]